MMPNLVNQTLGRYRILERLGQGKDAVVYRAQQINLARDVALKVVPANNAEGIERLRRESQLVARLDHPGIRQVLGIETATVQGAPPGSPTYVCAVLEYADQSLKALVEEHTRTGRAFTLHETVTILRPIADVLDYLASLGISHMDVKPENILLTAGGRILLSDFGVAQSFGLPMSHGTPAYVPPEVLEQGKQIVSGTDVYSLGVVAFQMLSGQLPFKADNATALYYAHTHTLPPMLDRVNSTCKNTTAWVVNQALAKTPAARYVTAGAFLTALERSKTFSMVVSTWPKRKPRQVAYASIGGLVVIAALVAFLTQFLPKGSGAAPPPMPTPPPAASYAAPTEPPPTEEPIPTEEEPTRRVVALPATSTEEPVSATATFAQQPTRASPTPVTPTVTRPPTAPPDAPQCNVKVDAPSMVAFYAPLANAKLKRGPIPLRGIVDFQEGARYQVHYEVRVHPSGNCEASSNTVVNEPVRQKQGSLGVWDASAATPGPYCLELRSVLNDGNYKVCNVLVTLE